MPGTSPGAPIPLGPFDLRRRIGAGGMGEVWLASHRVSGLPTAVKVVGGVPLPSSWVEAFADEVRAVAGLDHPGIVRIFDQGTIRSRDAERSEGRLKPGFPWLAMEYASGGDVLELRGKLGWAAQRRLLLGLLDALSHAHARDVVHLDLKPGNVVIATGADLRPGPKLTDFGLARLMSATDVTCVSIDPLVGSPSYIAPEQIQGYGRELGPWSDLYALGCLAWALCTGAAPFSGRGIANAVRGHLELPPPPLVPSHPVPIGFEGWLRQLLAKDPADRFRFASDAARALEEVDASGPSTHPQMPRTWRTHAPEPTRAPPPGGGLALWGLRTIPLAGRLGIRDRLWRALQQVARDQRPRTVVLEGPSGTGKSRLARWIAERAGELGAASRLTGIHDPIGGPSHGLVPVIERLVRSHGLEGDELEAHLLRWLQRNGGAGPSELWALSRLVGSVDGGATVEAAMPGSRGEGAQRHALIARMLARAAGGRVLVLVLEDVQWGPDTLAFVEFAHRAGRPARLPILFVLTAREEELAVRPALRRRLEEMAAQDGARRLRVGPLAPREHLALVRSLVGLEPGLARRVARRTGGNPLFAVLLVDDWIRRRALRGGVAGLELAAGEEAEAPRDVLQLGRALLHDALGRLEPGVQVGLELLAALGGRVDDEELRTACALARARHPGTQLEVLASRALAVRQQGTWTLTQAMLAEVLQGQAREAGRWQALNRACAGALQRLNAAPGGRIHARIGRHLLAADQLDRAADHLLLAARERVLVDDYAEAGALLDQADGALATTGRDGGRVRDPRSGRALALRALLHARRDDYEPALEAAARAELLARRWVWLRVEADALTVQGHVARRRGEYARSDDLLSRALERYRELDDPIGVSDCRQGLAMVALRQGRWLRAEELLRLTLERALATGDRPARVAALTTLAEVEQLTGRTEEARRRTTETIELARRIGSLWYLGFLQTSLGEMERLASEDLEAARELYLASAASFDAAGSPQSAIPRFNLAFLELTRGRYEVARPLLEASLEEVHALQWRTLEAGLNVALMICDAARGDWRSWGRHRDASFDVIRRAGTADPDAALHSRKAGQMALEAGRPAEAREAWELAREVWLRAGDTAAAEEVARQLEGLD